MELIARFHIDTELVAKFKDHETLIADFGNVSMGGGSDIPSYNGDYTVIPKTTIQKLETKEKRMLDDVTIREIPSYKVSNDKGGTTFVIGKELLNG